MCEKGWKLVKLDENAISPMRKKHQNLPSNNNDAQSITKYEFLVRPNAQIAALCLSSHPHEYYDGLGRFEVSGER